MRPPSGSCGRLGATFPTTGRFARNIRCSRSVAHPDLAVQVTLQPIDTIEVDAAILFSDLLLPFTPMGLDFDFVKGEGPIVENPIRDAADVERLTPFEPRESLAHVLETIKLLRRELAGRVPLIGFGGAPFTLAAYAIEGGPSRDYLRTKTFMHAQPRAWHRLCGGFADVMTDYLRAQVEPARRRCRSSTRGRARSAAVITASSCCRTRSGSSMASPGAACR